MERKFKFLMVCLSFTLFSLPSFGQENCEGETVDGAKRGHWKCFYDDGTVQQEGDYDGGQKVGEWIFYHSNGKVALKGNYVADVEKGKWEVYNEEGNKVDEIDYGD